ncbi:MAG: hypothetical protein HYX69_04900 [Planctomycetia bacterium]|nr:hypothetical protein [Planctomycetia bacterium]
MDERIEDLQRLPRNAAACQGAVLPLARFAGEDPASPAQARVPLWVHAESGLVYTDADALLSAAHDPLGAALEALIGFVETMQARPQRVEVRDPELAEYLRRYLPETGIEVQLRDRLPALDRAAKELAEMADAHAQGPPSLLGGRDVTIERIRAFADAAADFYRAAPWQYLSDSDLIEVESPKPPRLMGCFVVLGAGRSIYGLGLYPDRLSYERFLRAGQDADYDQAITSGVSQVTFDHLEEIPASDAALWLQHRLPVAADHAYPTAVKYGRNGQVSPPTEAELTFLEAILRALAETTESEIDAGRWSKEVATSDGPRTVTLRIPDLLDPPSPQEWIKRGFLPDRRAHERLFADMGRYLDENSLPEGDEQATISRVFAGRSFDTPLTQPRTTAEQAQDLCFQAFGAHGRRRVQLARRALQIDPDCADAHVILAEQAGSAEDELDHYRQATEAAERALGPEFFAENVGHFWGISQTRPYMRARFGLADALNAAGREEEAIELYRDLLRLNPNDNQGVRYTLLPGLMALGRDEEAAALLKQFDEESASWAYARALLAFRLGGRSDAAARELRAATRINEHVPELLECDEPIPQPPHYAIGSVEEACIAADQLQAAFHATPGALEWIAEEVARQARERDKVRREKRRKERARQKKRKGR